MKTATFKQYLLQFKNPSGTSRGVLHTKETFYMGYRNITLSTSGIVPRMYELASLGFPITLAVSLHAPTDEIRRTIMPIADTYSVSDIVAAADQRLAWDGHRDLTGATV